MIQQMTEEKQEEAKKQASKMKLVELESRKKELGLSEQLSQIKSQNAQLEQSAKALRVKFNESENELAEQKEMLNHMEIENNR